ncbi:MAG: hypothetical protein Q9191_000952 [Dirinaria sp. TL-2023a]
MPPRLITSSFSALSSFRPPFPYTCQRLRQPHGAASSFWKSNTGRRASSYNRFAREARTFGNQWRRSPNFYYHLVALGVGGVGVYAYNLERVPVTGRLRFNCVRESWELQASKSVYWSTLQQYRNQILPPNHPDSIMVNRVLQRLIPASGLGNEKWEVRVIDDKEEKNAFVLPGGKVFVFSGILPLCQGEGGLAAVLGHEIAHNVAHHVAEKMSHGAILFVALFAISNLLAQLSIDPQLTALAFQYLLLSPRSRAMESEADHIGLLMMAKSCYEPEKAVGFWERMTKAEKFAPPQWASTHPSSKNRILAIRDWIPAAQEARALSGCSGMSNHADDFARAFAQDPVARQVQSRRPVARQLERRDDDDDYFF